MTADIAVMATATVIAAVALVVVPMRRVHTPTSGPRIDRATRPGMALLIVDLQTDFVEGNGYDEHEVETTVGRINARAEEARAAGMPVATLRQIHRGPVATYCVRATAIGAIDRGYDVRLDDDLILAVDRSRWQGIREDLSADGAEVIVR